MDVIDTKIYRTRPATTLNTQLALVFPAFSRGVTRAARRFKSCTYVTLCVHGHPARNFEAASVGRCKYFLVSKLINDRSVDRFMTRYSAQR